MSVSPGEAYIMIASETDKEVVRVLYLANGCELILISLTHKDSLPFIYSYGDFLSGIESGSIILTADYPPAFKINPSEKQVQAAEKIWSIIGDFVSDEPRCYEKKILSRYIGTISKQEGVPRSQIHRYLCRYWAGGKTIHALYPNYNKRGGAGKARENTEKLGRPRIHPSAAQRVIIGEKDEAYIAQAVKRHYNKHTKQTLQFAYKKMLEEHYTDPETGLLFEAFPTESQFRYHAKKYIDLEDRYGHVVYTKDMRGTTGSSRQEAAGPGDVYQIDATIGDIYLVSKYNRQDVVGRPILYCIIDVFSRMIVGFSAFLEYASWDTAREALLQAFSPKVDYCKQYGITINEWDWPCSGIPRALVVDNGEMISKASNSIISGLGLTIKNAPAFRPDLKGIVESQFRLLNIDAKQSLPGAVLPDFGTRTGKDYRLDAKLTLDEFNKILILYVLEHNRRQMTKHPQESSDILGAHVPAIPIELWRWGIENRSGALPTMPREQLELALSQRDQATVTRHGIQFHGIYYSCATAQSEHWFSQARISKSWKISIAYHSRDMGKIYWIKPRGEYEECLRTPDSAAQFEDISFEELDWIQFQQSNQKSLLSVNK